MLKERKGKKEKRKKKEEEENERKRETKREKQEKLLISYFLWTRKRNRVPNVLENT